jgi:hypothetical protein
MAQEKTEKEARPGITQQQLQTIEDLSRTLRYGTLTLVFQDGVLVQVDRNEKLRIPREDSLGNK